MPTKPFLEELVSALVATSSFEEAAACALRSMFSSVTEALAGSRFAAQSKLLRGVVHVRPTDGYQRLYGLEHPSGAPTADTGYLTSATGWRWIVEHRCAISIDVQLGTIQPSIPDAPRVRGPSPLAGSETRERLIERDATHVHVVPLRAPGGAVSGMISLEANCQAAIGGEFIWDDCGYLLQLLADVAAPHLLALPSQPVAVRPDDFLPVVGPSTAGLVEILRVFARQEETLLLSGPTGVGKSRLARWCHEQSSRRSHRFEMLDLLAVPEELQMAELLGWKRGAFTSAVKDTPGAIARAAGGTLFLDEIDKLSLKSQAGLLRVLEERVYRPLGEDVGDQNAEVRFVVGTNANLLAAVRAGRFREDLYYRINVLPVRVPALSERLDELPLWAGYMLRRRHRESGGAGEPHVEPEAIELLLETPWPGNLRQLDNIVRRAYAFALLEHGGVSPDLALARAHVERALAYESAPDVASMLKLLWKAAHAFSQELERRSRAGSPIALELVDAFRSMVIGSVVLRLGKGEQAMTLLGLQHLLKNRNHYRALHREFERIRELATALGGAVDPDLGRLLQETESRSAQD